MSWLIKFWFSVQLVLVDRHRIGASCLNLEPMLKPITLLLTRSTCCNLKMINMKAILAFKCQVLTFGKFHAYFMANNLMPVAEIIPRIAAITGSEQNHQNKKNNYPYETSCCIKFSNKY